MCVCLAASDMSVSVAACISDKEGWADGQGGREREGGRIRLSGVAMPVNRMREICSR